MNPNHDEKGRFTSGSGGGGSAARSKYITKFDEGSPVRVKASHERKIKAGTVIGPGVTPGYFAVRTPQGDRLFHESELSSGSPEPARKKPSRKRKVYRQGVDFPLYD